MSTTPTIFKRPIVKYTVVGGKKKERFGEDSTKLTVLILGRGGRFYRGNLLKEVLKHPVCEILYLEGPDISYDVEPLFRQYPEVRFLLLRTDTSTGEKINLGIEESRSRFVFVLWSDMHIRGKSLSTSLQEKIDASGALCTTPVLRNPEGEVIPSVRAPAFLKGKLKIVPWAPVKDETATLYPFDYCGIYHKEKFLFTGGYDYTITHPYWQKLDLGFRAHLWGERLVCSTTSGLDYLLEVPAEDNTPDESYRFFYVKNLAIRFRRDMAALANSRFFHYMLHSNNGPLHSLREFLRLKKWVELNRYRFKRDAKGMVGLWEMPE